MSKAIGAEMSDCHESGTGIEPEPGGWCDEHNAPFPKTHETCVMVRVLSLLARAEYRINYELPALEDSDCAQTSEAAKAEAMQWMSEAVELDERHNLQVFDEVDW